MKDFQADQSSIQAAKAIQVQQQILEKCMIQSNALWWARNWTLTYDQDWSRKGLVGPYHSFPAFTYLDYLFDFITEKPKLIQVHNKKVRLFVKSRKTLASWSCVAKFLHRAQTLPEQEIIFQSQQQKKGNYLIEYAKTLYRNQPEWMQANFPLAQKIDDFAMDRLEWQNGSKIISIPEGADQIRTFHPSVLFMDESAFQPEGEAAYDNALSSAGLIVLVSTPEPGWFQELVDESELPVGARVISEGVFFTETQKQIPVLWIRDDAIPERNAEWQAEEQRNYKLDSSYQREHRLNFTAGGGERVLREIFDRRKSEILITGLDFKPSPFWRHEGGFDWGKTHPASFHDYATDEDGVLYALEEHYRGGLTPAEHSLMIRGMKLYGTETPVLALMKDTGIHSDPSIFYESQATNEGFTSIVELFDDAISDLMVKGKSGEDLTCVEWIIQAWSGPKIMFKIFCPQPYDRKREGTYHGCPNLVWELVNLKREQFTSSQLLKRNPSDKLVDVKNDAFDDFKYFWSSRPEPAELPIDEKFKRYRAQRPEPMGVNAGIMAYQDFLKRNQPAEGLDRWA